MTKLLLITLCAVLAATSNAQGYTESWYNQTLDHFHFEEHTRFQHRYLINDSFWGKQAPLANGCKGPILLYTGNEGPITAFWGISGFVTEVLGPNFGGLLLFPEQRYYGKSLPFGDASYTPKNVVYLTTEQVLEDYIELLDHIKSTMNAENCPVIAFGGSYGGTLTTFIRAKYPNAIAGGLAASAPIGYYDPDGWAEHGVDEFTWSDIVTKDYDEAHPKCLDAIHATIEAVNSAPIADVVSAFGVCEAKGLGPDLPSELFQYSLENIPQQDYPYPIGNNPAWPVNATCAILVKALAESEANGDVSPLIAAAVNVTDTQVGTHSTKACFPTLIEGPGSVPGDGPGPGNWGFQSCTENLHMFSARSPSGAPSGIRDFKFNLSKVSGMCNGIFGVRPDPMALAKRYGGYKLGDGLTGVSNLIWSNGALDPWHGGGFLKPGDPSTGNHWILMQKGAHHLDLRAPNPADPAEVTAARVLEESIIGGWIKDASQP